MGANVIKRIEHIGSTRYPNIWAKNIVDILLEVGGIEDLQRVRDLLVKNGWLVMSGNPNRISLNKVIQSRDLLKVFSSTFANGGDHDEIYLEIMPASDMPQAYQN